LKKLEKKFFFYIDISRKINWAILQWGEVIFECCNKMAVLEKFQYEFIKEANEVKHK